jgi:hypothetical protein
MAAIKGINFHCIFIVLNGKDYHRNDVEIGSLKLSLFEREFILDIKQSYSDAIEKDGTLKIMCDIETDEDLFPSLYDLTESDMLNPDLKRELHITGEAEFEIVSITLFFDDCNGKEHRLLVDKD